MGTRSKRPVKRDSLTPTLPSSLQGLVRHVKYKRSPLAYAVHRIPGGAKTVFQMLALSVDPNAVRVVKMWEKMQNVKGSETWMLEDIVREAGLSPKAFIGLVASEAYQMNVDLGHLIANFSYPKIMQASVARAQDPDATAERRMHFEASRYVPTKAGIQIGIRNVNNPSPEEEEAIPGQRSSFDRTARRVVRELPPSR